MSQSGSSARIGVFADVPNMYRGGGQRLQYDVLRRFACRDGAEPVRLNAYVTYDIERAGRDDAYRDGARSFHSKLRDYGYKVLVKKTEGILEPDAARMASPEVGLELAVDAMSQAESLDRIVLGVGHADYVPLVEALQARGRRVEVVGLSDTDHDLREAADVFVSGFLVPGMIPVARGGQEAWGDVGSRVRGLCYWFESERQFGYLRFLRDVSSNLWYTDARLPDSPWGTAYFRESQLPPGVRTDRLPSRDYVFEFELEPSERGEGFQAGPLEVVARG